MVRMAYDEKSKTEISDEGPFEVLHMHGFPADIVPAVNRYNREHPGPDGNAINISQTCIDALRRELKIREGSVCDHPLQSMTTVPSVGPVELQRAADLIKGMGSRPEDAKAGDGAQLGSVMGRNDSIWVCSHCLTLISDYRYQHLNPDGCCPECETQLIQYSRVIWSP